LGVKAKEARAGEQIHGRIINTSSEAGLAGPVGQANYGTAKAGITALTLRQSLEERANASWSVRPT
jgi:3-oxoacyl-[acyl-carrier protein] reductase